MYRLIETRPPGRTDYRHSANPRGPLEREQHGSESAHRVSNDADPASATSEPLEAAERNELVNQHSKRVIPGVGVPITVPAIDRRESHGWQWPAGNELCRRPPKIAFGQRIGVVGSVPVKAQHQRQGMVPAIARWQSDGVTNGSASVVGVKGTRVR